MKISIEEERLHPPTVRIYTDAGIDFLHSRDETSVTSLCCRCPLNLFVREGDMVVSHCQRCTKESSRGAPTSGTCPDSIHSLFCYWLTQVGDPLVGLLQACQLEKILNQFDIAFYGSCNLTQRAHHIREWQHFEL